MEYARMLGIAAALAVLTGWLYYRELWAAVLVWPVFVLEYKTQLEACEEKKKQEFLVQFKEMIQSMSASLNTGYSVENAVRETQKELTLLYPKEAMITKELGLMARQIQIQIPMEQVFEEFAERVRLEDVQNFTAVFAAAKRSGGDMIAIIRNTAQQIADKIDVKREIDTILAAKKYEFRVMSAIPYLIIAYMSVSFPEFMECLYGNVLGVGVMSVCLSVYMGAYTIGLRLVKIEV